MSVNAFHEKAGRSQVDSFLFFIRRAFVLPSGHCRHASIRTLEERLVSLGACWAFSFQPVLPSDYRPVVLLLQTRTRARRLTQSPELGLGFIFLFLGRFCFYAAATTVVGLLWCKGSYTSPLTHR